MSIPIQNGSKTDQVDILIPAALENAINRDNMDNIRAELIAEFGNGPLRRRRTITLMHGACLSFPTFSAMQAG